VTEIENEGVTEIERVTGIENDRVTEIERVRE
jgi:hypothetical protein